MALPVAALPATAAGLLYRKLNRSEMKDGLDRCLTMTEEANEADPVPPPSLSLPKIESAKQPGSHPMAHATSSGRSSTMGGSIACSTAGLSCTCSSSVHRCKHKPRGALTASAGTYRGANTATGSPPGSAVPANCDSQQVRDCPGQAPPVRLPRVGVALRAGRGGLKKKT